MVYHSRRLDRTFGALADPTRRAILERLAGGSETISELAARHAMSLPAVSKHVRVLARAGLLRIAREGRARRCTLRAVPLRDAASWIEQHQAYWESSFDRLSIYLQETASTEEVESWPKRQSVPRSGRASRGGSRRRASASSRRGPRRKR